MADDNQRKADEQRKAALADVRRGGGAVAFARTR